MPLSTLRQWESEITRFTRGKLKVVYHYGNFRVKDRADWNDADVVLTTYGTMSADIAVPDNAVDEDGKEIAMDVHKVIQKIK